MTDAETEKKVFIDMASSYQKRRGFKRSWIYVIYKKRFGTWPGALFKQKVDLEPNQNFLDWVKNHRLEEPDSAELQAKIAQKLEVRMMQKSLPRKGKTAIFLAKKFGVGMRTVQRYTSVPRPQYLATHTISISRPWEAMEMSRATWYRKGKPLQAPANAD